MKATVFIFKVLRKIFHQRKSVPIYNKYVQYKNQEANDFIRNLLHNHFASDTTSGLMLAKFGTIELGTFASFESRENGLPVKDIFAGIRGYMSIFPELELKNLCNNAVFFPESYELGKQFTNLVKSDAKYIDILASYQRLEKRLKNELQNCIRVNLDGYYAPFMWKNPWTMELRGKNVLVVHPFAKSIEAQYKKREKLFDNPDVLPEFKSLVIIKAVQSIGGSCGEDGYETWFDALKYMEREISKIEFDVAIIGCGAYGLHLAAFVKRIGKVAIHLAGWTQMLFGIYGSRWINAQKEYAKFINENWVRPLPEEKPEKADTVENGCYW